MSSPNTDVLGAQYASPAAGGVGIHVPGADVLAFTGTGPGTLPLAIVGFAALVAGGLAVCFGRRRPRGEAGSREDDGPLRDLSHLAHGSMR